MGIDTLESIKNEIDRIKKRNLRVYAIMTAIMLITLIGVIVFYETRILSITGEIYGLDKEFGKVLVNELYFCEYSIDNVSRAFEAIQVNGYTENGYYYLFSISGAGTLLWIVAAVMLFLICAFVHEYIYMCNNNAYSLAQRVADENEKLKKQLAAEVESVQKHNRQLQDFIENIAHQVKTPLTAISLILDIGGPLEDCFFHVERIKEFIQRLLKISRMESGKVIFAREDIFVGEMLQEAVSYTNVPKDVVHINCSDMDYTVNGDREWLKEAFINIIINSAEYIHQVPKGKIDIDVNCMTDRCLIIIRDNGPGFKGEEARKVFDRFETRRDSNSFHVGIGLNLSKLIIEAHKGIIMAENVCEGSGAQFKISLPRYYLKKKNEEVI